MKIADFKDHIIKRDCCKEFEDYHDYLPYLKNDFHNRCCYCNMSDDLINPLSFHIDHFIPISTFKGLKDSLKTNYNNLMYACPKCNLAKSNKFEGEIIADKIENHLFYNPVDKDYNEIFYRDENGCIATEDEFGKKMLVDLKLYRRVHQISWIIEELENTYNKLETELDREKDQEKLKILKLAYDKLGHALYIRGKTFRAGYKDGFDKYITK